MRSVFGFIVFITAFLLSGCGQPKNENESSLNDTSAYEEPMAEYIPAESSDYNDCGTLEPLLSLLPSETETNDAIEIVRECSSGDNAVILVHSNETQSGIDDEQIYAYEYQITVLDGNSSYLDSLVDVYGATEEQITKLRNMHTSTGELHKIRWETCKAYHEDPPVIGDPRMQLIASVNTLDVCVVDNMDANDEIWQMYGVYQNVLMLKLTLTGAKAKELMSSEQAKIHLAPYFERFVLSNGLP